MRAGCIAIVCLAIRGGAQVSYSIEAMPSTHNLLAYDDCGIRARQPHVQCEGVYVFPPQYVNADLRDRSVAWGWREVRAVYEGLRPEVEYVLAITYANEGHNNRAQSLWAGGIRLHGPRPLPRGGRERLLFRVPPEAIRSGRLELEFRLEAEVNVVVSAIELWAPLPAPRELHLSEVSALYKDLEGYVLDYAWRPVAGALVRLEGLESPDARAQTREDGSFRFPRSAFAGQAADAGLVVVASHDGIETRHQVPPEDLNFEPVRYRPMPSTVSGIKNPTVKLDGLWRIGTDDPSIARQDSLSSVRWRTFRVPGQWLQQGFDVAQDKAVSVATEFTVPPAWEGRRVILRFDAVHAGTRYWINGVEIGRSENLFTPVEWDITDHVRFGAPNRLDMEMVVQTESERLAHASGYAFHSLGGIPRSVRIFALPETHIRALRIQAGLTPDHGSGTLDVKADLAGPMADRAAVRVTVHGTNGTNGTSTRAPAHVSQVPHSSHSLTLTLPRVRPWSPEKPHRYLLDVELLLDGRPLERITRSIGFRTVEVRGSELLVNGRPVKLAGACRHETHPLTGRADTARWAEEDVRLIKEANLNYIRTAHYPPTEEFMNECDRQGVFVEVEAPFCWVGEEGYESLRAILTPTSAMVDYHHMHPSAIIWSLANESTFNPCFEVSNRLVKDLDPTRPTTFNNPDPKRICDIANVHYPRMPFDDYDKDDPRPLLLGEYFFPVCHEQTDVRRNPGLRELWGAGHSDPESEYGRAMAREFEWPYMQPGEPPGAWTHIVRSRRVIGGAIWAALDEPFYLPGGKNAGYAWVHGFWGIIDGWRRPKPEHWLARQIFSPVWFPVRRLPFVAGQTTVTIPVENRFAFTDLSELRFRVKVGNRSQAVRARGVPGSHATISVPLPPETAVGAPMVCEVSDKKGRQVAACTMWLGEPARTAQRPERAAQTPVRLQAPADLGGAAGWPTFHATRFDFADLWPAQPPFAVLPTDRAAATSRDSLPPHTVSRTGGGVTIHEKWADFEGDVTLTPGSDGSVTVAYDFAYTGPDFHAREIGLRIPFPGHGWTVAWDRRSEWGDAPDDTIMRPRGSARPWRGSRRSSVPESVRPRWPWALDETEEGTAGFRAVKLNVHEASLTSKKGDGVAVLAAGDIHIRAAVEGPETAFYLLTRCGLAPRLVRQGDRLTGEFVVLPKQPTKTRLTIGNDGPKLTLAR